MSKPTFAPFAMNFGVSNAENVAKVLELLGYTVTGRATVGECDGFMLYHRLIGMNFYFVLYTLKKPFPTAPGHALPVQHPMIIHKVDDMDEAFSYLSGRLAKLGAITGGYAEDEQARRMTITTVCGFTITVLQEKKAEVIRRDTAFTG